MKILIKNLCIFVVSIIASAVFTLAISSDATANDIQVFDPSGWHWYGCSTPATGDTTPANENFYEPPPVLKNKFPFDLIYPTTPQDMSATVDCQSVSLWGKSRDLCSPKMVTQVVKSTFLFQFVLRSLLAL